MNFTPKVLLRSEESGGHVALCENVAPPRWPGPPLHHHDFDEAFYVLEGELIFQVDDALVTKGAGELAFAPRNVAHARLVDLEEQLALEHVEGLVEVVRVQRRSRAARRDHDLGHGHVAAGLLAAQ